MTSSNKHTNASKRRKKLLTFALGTVFGILFWGGFNTAVEYTNTTSFCISCHEMRDTVYVEYQKSVHFSNPSGMRVSCLDCYVPRPLGSKMWRKIQASNELYHKLLIHIRESLSTL